MQLFNQWDAFLQTHKSHYFSLKKSSINSDLQDSWWLINSDEVIIANTIKSVENGNADLSLFDTMYSTEESVSSTNDYSLISALTLREVSEAYSFSLAYLGDFLCEMGCPSPIDMDSRLGDLLTGDQVYTLLQAITSIDPMEAGYVYDTLSLQELAEEANVDVEHVFKLCQEENIHLPFGKKTKLHNSMIERLQSKLQYGE
mmetsp:Transcript_30643/g.43982  ORF Transcript_30643/g.43982 Transcript_30643/m.43982 type:complete len:201 (-) Transcript_30643:1572-2174(-)